jgi:hypothetical protein
MRFKFGPTAHGATVSHLLERDAAEKGAVAWRTISFYA